MRPTSTFSRWGAPACACAFRETAAIAQSGRATGARVYFASGRRVWQCAVRAGDSFTFDPPTTVFTLDRDVADFDVSPDGQRFLVQLTPPSDFLPYRVMVNWRAVMRGAVR